MEERQDNTKNIKALGQILKDGSVDKLLDKIKTSQQRTGAIVKKLADKESELAAKAAELAALAQQDNYSAGNNGAEADVSVLTVADNSVVSVDTPIAAVSDGKSPVDSENVIVSEPEIRVNSDNPIVDKAEDKESEIKVADDKAKTVAPSVLQPDNGSDFKSDVSPNADNSSEQAIAAKVAPSTATPKNDAVTNKNSKADTGVVADRSQPRNDRDSNRQSMTQNGRSGSKNVKIPPAVKNKPTENAAISNAAKPQPAAAQSSTGTNTAATDKPARPSILSFIVRKADPAQPQVREYTPDNKRERSPRPYGDRPAYNRPAGTGAPRPYGDRPAFGGTGARPSFGARPQGGAFTPGGARPGIKRPAEMTFIPQKDNKPIKKKSEKSFEDKHTINKKSLIKELTVADFDENKTGYRKVRRPKQKKEEQSNFIKIEKATITKEITPIKELSEKLGISAVDITKRLFKEGITKTINDSIDFDTAAFIASDLGIQVEQKYEKSAEDVMNESFMDESDNDVASVKRPPVVTVMGHVDHGKTSLLDRIRSASVAEGEAGGITQHIGAYSVDVKGNKITFIDTPGHAAFTAMRARGAQVTDIAIIVVAADDGVMPQTIEAINHAKAAKVSMIVAANKIDKPHVDLDRVRKELSEHDVLVEEWGGDVIMVPVSAKTGEGIDKLMESILLIAEMKELKANPDRKARGTVIEAKLDKGKGPMATVLVQNGTLHTGDNVVAGTVVGRVRAMINDKGNNVKEAGPSVAVAVLGLEDVPNAGDAIFSVDEEKLSKLVAQERKNKEREDMIREQSKVSLDELFSKISDGLKVLNIIIKADVQGSAEAVKQSLSELSDSEIKVNVLHAGVGAINESDVMLADSSNSIIIGFNVRPDTKAKALSEHNKIDIKLYRIIYDAIDDVKKAMQGMLAPKFSDVYTGKAEVRETFKISGVGTIAGCYVTDGKIARAAKLRIYRDDVMICEGNVKQLKRFKDEVKEVAQGFECGISIENFNDIKVGDFIESYITEESK